MNHMSGSGAEADTEGQGGEPVGAAGGDSTPSLSTDRGLEPEKSQVLPVPEADSRVRTEACTRAFS